MGITRLYTVFFFVALSVNEYATCMCISLDGYHIPSPFVLRRSSAYRTPICKAKRGSFKDTYPEDLLTVVLKVYCLCDPVSLVLVLITSAAAFA